MQFECSDGIKIFEFKKKKERAAMLAKLILKSNGASKMFKNDIKAWHMMSSKKYSKDTTRGKQDKLKETTDIVLNAIAATTISPCSFWNS